MMNVTLPGRCRPSWLAVAACLLGPGIARAQEDALDSVPGSPRPPGVGMSPEAPPTPPAPGGRAPSFGAPSNPDSWVFRLGGRLSAWGQAGIGSRTTNPQTGERGLPLHTPARTVGNAPIYAGTAASLSFQYGNQVVMAFASYEAALAGAEYEGYYRADKGPRFRSAYITLTPPALGRSRLRFQVGAFPASYGAPGPWGWGTFGPVIGVHGYGGIAALEHELSANKVLSFEYGVSAVSEVPENFVRGTYTEWPENGLSSIVNHAHAGFSLQNKYFAKLHFAYADGRNMRTYLDADENVAGLDPWSDGAIEVAALELRLVADPWGQLGVTPVFWNFDNARSVHDGLWWGLGWTAGGREMTNRYLGPASDGTGQIMAVSTEYNFSVSRMLTYPEPFDGNGRDLRVNLAFLPHWTLKTNDPGYDGADGYFVGATVEHVLFRWLSSTYRVFGESRDATRVEITGERVMDRSTAYSATLGLALHSDWQSRDRMELAYSRYFYSNLVDNNPVQPLDREVFTLGASVAF